MSKSSKLFRLSDQTVVYLEMNPVDTILKDKGLDLNGDVQMFHTQNVLRRITKYMPMRSGMTIKVTIAQTSITVPKIVTDVPYGKYLYYGKSKNDKPLNYTRTYNPKAGGYWDRALSAQEGAAMRDDLQSFIKLKKGK